MPDPGDPPPPPRILQGLDPRPLWVDNPFSYIPKGQRGQTGRDSDRPSVTILRFAKNAQGEPRAQLKASNRIWVDPLDEFETYIVLEINEEEGYVLLQDTTIGAPVRIEKE